MQGDLSLVRLSEFVLDESVVYTETKVNFELGINAVGIDLIHGNDKKHFSFYSTDRDDYFKYKLLPLIDKEQGIMKGEFVIAVRRRSFMDRYAQKTMIIVKDSYEYWAIKDLQMRLATSIMESEAGAGMNVDIIQDISYSGQLEPLQYTSVVTLEEQPFPEVFNNYNIEPFEPETIDRFTYLGLCNTSITIDVFEELSLGNFIISPKIINKDIDPNILMTTRSYRSGFKVQKSYIKLHIFKRVRDGAYFFSTVFPRAFNYTDNEWGREARKQEIMSMNSRLRMYYKEGLAQQKDFMETLKSSSLEGEITLKYIRFGHSNKNHTLPARTLIQIVPANTPNAQKNIENISKAFIEELKSEFNPFVNWSQDKYRGPIVNEHIVNQINRRINATKLSSIEYTIGEILSLIEDKVFLLEGLNFSTYETGISMNALFEIILMEVTDTITLMSYRDDSGNAIIVDKNDTLDFLIKLIKNKNFAPDISNLIELKGLFFKDFPKEIQDKILNFKLNIKYCDSKSRAISNSLFIG